MEIRRIFTGRKARVSIFMGNRQWMLMWRLRGLIRHSETGQATLRVARASTNKLHHIQKTLPRTFTGQARFPLVQFCTQVRSTLQEYSIYGDQHARALDWG